MKHFNSKTSHAVLFALLLAAGAQGANISGTITTTLTITGQNTLTGNVQCNIPAGSTCIKFGADNTELNLNNFTIRGDLGPCGPNRTAIDTNGHDNANIHGPGLLTLFSGNGIILSGSNSVVHQVVLTYFCFNGIVVDSFEGPGGNNSVSQNSISNFGFLGANGIAVQGTGANQIQQNAITGGLLGSGGYGIIVTPSSDKNSIQQNNVSANLGGIVVFDGSVSNVIENNQALGSSLSGVFDLWDGNTVTSNTYRGNLCQFYVGPPPAVCPAFPADLIGNPISLQDQNSQGQNSQN